MPTLAATRSVNARYKPSYLPVAVIIGGTSGIGKHTAQALAKYTKGNAHIILIGRNEAAAKDIIESFPKPSGPDAHPDWKHEFIHCDATLMKNVRAACKSISSRVMRVNFLILSHGRMGFKGREEVEGIDINMATRYYSRWVFTQELLPLLRNAGNAKQKASVLTILGAGWGAKIDLDDLDLKKKYTGMRCSLTTVTYNDLMTVVCTTSFV
jgi:NAD(P)-dependent dehydrogenase (short-subunit alcohol dehydrogenase family)